MNEPFNSFSSRLKQLFPGKKIRKIPLHAGFPCPNKKTGGCIFCDPWGSGPIDTYHLPLAEQISLFKTANPGFHFISYLQSNSNTAAPPDELRRVYETALAGPETLGLFIGTRPDAVAQEILPLLEEFNRRTYFSIELGLQSIYDSSLEFLRRGHSYGCFLETFSALKERGIEVIVHLILGLPGEGQEELLATAREMNRLQPAGLKLHLLHVLKNTPLYELQQNHPLPLLSRDEFVQRVVTFLEHLDPDIVIHRLTGERDDRIFHAPKWVLQKQQVLQSIRDLMRSRGSRQGCRVQALGPETPDSNHSI